MNHENASAGYLKEFTEANSFRLCTEGLQALERFERDASATQLEIAERKLEECVARYPSDLIPKFYLGTVKTLKGYESLAMAEELLTQVAERGSGDLRAAAQFNLAVANIERYDVMAFARASEILGKLAADPTVPERTKWTARSNQLYIKADLLWRRRRLKTPEDIEVAATAPALREEFANFKAALDKSDSKHDSEILADYWNALGTLSEAQSYFNPERKAEFAAEAEKQFRKALEYKVDWIAATSNLARLHQDVLGDPNRAEELWNKVFDIRPDDQYAHYNLGRLEQSRGNLSLARKHFQHAPDIEGAQKALQDLPAE